MKSIGVVRFINKEKCFGIIDEEGTNSDYYFHITELQSDKINEGSRVQFNCSDEKGINAINIKTI